MNPNALFYAGNYDRIVFHFDGNNNDPDDIAAMAVAALIAKAAGVEDRIVFFHNNNIFEPSVAWQVDAMNQVAAFAESLGITTHSYEGQAATTTAELTGILDSGEKVLLLEGGPMTATYNALQGVSSGNLSNISLMSHSNWNENQGVPWSTLKDDYPEITYFDIIDQNGFTTGTNNAPGSGFKSKWWNWMDDPNEPLASNPVVVEANALMGLANGPNFDPDSLPEDSNQYYYDISYDASDAGMLMYALHGLDANGNPSERSNPRLARDFLAAGEPLEKTSSDIGSNPALVHEFKDGWAKIEAESATWDLPNSASVDKWKLTNEFDFTETGSPQLGNKGPIEDSAGLGSTGDGVMWWTGPNYFDDSFAGLSRTAPLLYRFEIGEEDIPANGTLKIGFNIRVMKPDGAGVGASDAANDVFFKFGAEGTFNGTIDREGWRKIHVKPFDGRGNPDPFEPMEWDWIAHYASGGRDVPLHYNITEAGIYEFAIGGRSKWTAIDQIQILDVDNYPGRNAYRAESAATPYQSGPANAAPVVLDDQESVVAGETRVIDVLANDSDPDGDPLTLDAVAAPPDITARIVNGQIEVVVAANVVGTQAIDYTASDGNGGTSAGVLTLTVSPPAPPPPPPTQSGEVAGRVFIDGDRDGLNGNDADDPGLAGLTVTLFKDGSAVDTTVTNESGWYLFSDVPADSGYSVRVYKGDERLDFAPSPGQWVGGAGNLNSAVFRVEADDKTPGVHGMFAPPGAAVGQLEMGRVTLGQDGPDSWINVSFAQAIDNAVVVLGPASSNGNSPVIGQVKDVTSTGFKMQISEWAYLNGWHAEETIGWMAMSEGRHTLIDGTVVEAGHVSASNETTASVSYSQAFGAGPLVFAQLSTDNGNGPATTRISDVSAAGFDVAMQEEEAADGLRTTETLSWIAVENRDNVVFDAAGTVGLDHTWSRLDGDAPTPTDVLIADMQTMNGPDTADLRMSEGSRGWRVRVQEEASADAEETHASETLGYLVGQAGSYDLFA
ncbi:MAG: Ig-like domain-containing protein [Pseudomonadota bacterium]